MNFYISLLGALTAIIVSLIGAWFAIRNSIVLESRKLKEDHYVKYIEALHNLASDNNKVEYVKNYTFARDKMFIVAHENVVNKMLDYENNIKSLEKHDLYLTELIKAIRKDLKITDKKFPLIYLKK